MLSRLSCGAVEDGDDIATARESINHCWDVLSDVRATMRTDLKVTGPSYE
ncbi:hypothetical protein ACFXEL_34495 [Streptomyces sp. NPDC059382]